MYDKGEFIGRDEIYCSTHYGMIISITLHFSLAQNELLISVECVLLSHASTVSLNGQTFIKHWPCVMVIVHRNFQDLTRQDFVVQIQLWSAKREGFLPTTFF